MDRTRKLLLALAAAAVAATLLALRGWIAPATARWVLLALLVFMVFMHEQLVRKTSHC